MRDEKRLGRLLRVRSLQRDQRRAEEVIARQHHASTAELLQRIDRLHDDVSPTSGTSFGFSLAAAAGYRDRLHVSRLDARGRLNKAEQVVEARRAATLEAERDHGAIEKLMERAERDRALAEMRRMMDEAPTRRNGTLLAEKETSRN